MSKDRFIDPLRKPRPKSAFISRLKYLTLKLIIAAGMAVMRDLLMENHRYVT
ncbi:hypothetical protein PhaeoP10_01682 [Phaeobacter inhibens]|nr:hypothetical protein PhaeoP10_01682 [Phaeobacter inhibens]